MIKLLVTMFALGSALILMIISVALTKDVYDPNTKEKIEDREGKLMGYIGYGICALIIFGWCRYLFR
jgi:hypothetical protein